MFLVDLADSLHALVDGLVVGVCSALRLVVGLEEEDSVGHSYLILQSLNLQ